MPAGGQSRPFPRCGAYNVRPMRSWIVVVTGLAGLGLGFVLGRAGTGASDDVVPRRDLERIERRLDEAMARIERAERPAPPPVRGTAPNSDATAAPGGPGPTTPPASAPTAGPATDRERAVATLVAGTAARWETHDGEGLLDVLRKLSAIVPEGRGAAMDLAARIHDDLRTDRSLGIDEVTLYQSLGDGDLRDLMIWALENPSPPGFRTLAAWSLPWVVPRERAISVLTEGALRETDPTAQQAFVASLARMRDSRVDAALGKIFADAARPAELRARIAIALSDAADPAIVEMLREAAAGDADASVRAAAKTVLTLRDPPVDGYALMTVAPDGAGAAAGLRVGDIVTAYDGHPVRTTEEFQAAIEGAADDGAPATVTIAFLRAGEPATADVRRGRLGVQGRAVRRR